MDPVISVQQDLNEPEESIKNGLEEESGMSKRLNWLKTKLNKMLWNFFD